MDSYEFSRQQRTFAVHGYALDPTANGGTGVVGSLEAAQANGFSMVDTFKVSRATRRAEKRKRQAGGDASIVDGDGAYVGPWADYEGAKEVEEEVEEDAEEWREEKRRREEAKEAAQAKMKAAREEKSIFHGKELHDYAGRTYMHIPNDVDVKLNPSESAPPPNAYVPSGKCIHTWTGHNKGVSAIRLFPKSGHLLLSGSMDTKIKVSWVGDWAGVVLTGAALGRLPRRQLSANLPRPLTSGQGRHVQQRRIKVLVVFVRPHNQAVGHGDGQVYPGFLERQGRQRCQVQPRWRQAKRLLGRYAGQEDYPVRPESTRDHADI